jgi:hypothetical protein
MLHVVDISFEAILDWKCHLLRAVHQDKAREHASARRMVVRFYKGFHHSGLRNDVFASTFKETQVEWFGKRGITWHISYCVRKLL